MIAAKPPTLQRSNYGLNNQSPLVRLMPCTIQEHHVDVDLRLVIRSSPWMQSQASNRFEAGSRFSHSIMPDACHAIQFDKCTTLTGLELTRKILLVSMGNSGFLPFWQSWLCNTKYMNGVHRQVLNANSNADSFGDNLQHNYGGCRAEHVQNSVVQTLLLVAGANACRTLSLNTFQVRTYSPCHFLPNLSFKLIYPNSIKLGGGNTAVLYAWTSHAHDSVSMA
jgi:hypothetical protein